MSSVSDAHLKAFNCCQFSVHGHKPDSHGLLHVEDVWGGGAPFATGSKSLLKGFIGLLYDIIGQAVFSVKHLDCKVGTYIMGN